VASAKRRVLYGDASLAEPGDHVRHHRRAVGADHHHHTLAAGRFGRVDGVIDEGAASQPVQHLRRRRLHARALASGEDDGGAGGHGRSPEERSVESLQSSGL
jgi:hypothetical protein